jgi:GNAT superfamily N-acetyltransferase
MAQIERAGVKDHGFVTTLLIDYMREQEPQLDIDRDLWDRTIAQLLDSDRWLFLLAFEGEDPVALVIVNWFITLNGQQDQGRLVAITVEEQHRRKGIGSNLMRDVLAAARRRGCKGLEAPVRQDDERLARFIWSCGK